MAMTPAERQRKRREHLRFLAGKTELPARRDVTPARDTRHDVTPLPDARPIEPAHPNPQNEPMPSKQPPATPQTGPGASPDASKRPEQGVDTPQKSKPRKSSHSASDAQRDTVTERDETVTVTPAQQPVTVTESVTTTVTDQEQDGVRWGQTGRKPTWTRATVSAVADLIAQGLTEGAACALLKLNPRGFRDWKSRTGVHDAAFRERLNLAYAARTARLLGVVEDAATIGDEKRGKDWRAATWIMERVPGYRETFSPSTGSGGGPGPLVLVQIGVAEGLPQAVKAAALPPAPAPQAAIDV